MFTYVRTGKQWVGYDDVGMIEHKSRFIKDNGYGGGMIWALDLDDFKGQFCGCGKYPLLTAINRVLRNYSGGSSQCNPAATQFAYGSYLQQYTPAAVVYPWHYFYYK